MATKEHFDSRAKAHQSTSRAVALHTYRQRVPTAVLVERSMARYAAKPTPMLSDSDWCAFPPATREHAPKMTGLARGSDGSVVYQWKPATDQMKLVQAAQRIGVAA